ncbi:aspartyl-phosphate phosphatase Spo0E family protein [Heliorestis convoluta]|uniref:Spo0E like sporulation regulatory family protein n=1 Tax=Heliorestis convoluta TaxID=356322 RepID=A0A5Q2N1Y7_9FIRM|nr:aspartyl-phosphate phosphatase Spo0E family protein [Heliorestis convoluta]QGG48311.1 spo0E like sporulation regulatory family protein [Heliorestis convoluta]
MREKLALLRKIDRKRKAMYRAAELGQAYETIYKLSCELDVLIVEYMKKYQQTDLMQSAC